VTILLADPRVHAIRVRDNGDPLIPLAFAPDVLVRAGLARRLTAARAALPAGVSLRVVEGHRSVTDQQAIIDEYTSDLRVLYPDADDAELGRLSSRFVAPVAVAPHVAGAAVDLTLVDDSGDELWMGTPVDATPEQSDGACWFDADVDLIARDNRRTLARALSGAGLINYPTEWWHWSYGDRYWALLTGAEHAVYGPVDAGASACASW
jgi:D-alanyl-D-alanine dipeptidase